MAVFLTDFGLARDTGGHTRFTRTGEPLGTPSYMSPEQARGEADLTPATDTWALGCIGWELIAGRRAFDGQNPADVLNQVCTGEPPPLRALRPDVPSAVAALWGAALRKAAAAR